MEPGTDWRNILTENDRRALKVCEDYARSATFPFPNASLMKLIGLLAYLLDESEVDGDWVIRQQMELKIGAVRDV